MGIKQKFFNQTEMRTGPCLSQYFGRRRREFRCRGMPSPGNREASAAAWGSFRTASATLMLSSELPPGTLCAATGWASSSRGVPMTPRTMPDDRPLKRPAPLWRRVAQAAGRTAFSLSLSMRLGLPHCRLTLRTAELPVGPCRAAAGSLARSYRAERPATEHGHKHFPVPLWRRCPNRPNEFLPPQMPSRRWNHSASARWRCTKTSVRRFVPCRFHWRIEVTQLAPYFPHGTEVSHAK
ncbi:hypothetical protein TCDM_11240 [Trypanosoma cruzi Dm28c]|uniref:Uncharacterized protein n=1 Tax=Trypanosoma cruzi Dm28c TaxID=1416333 RepID=V5AKJ6_TRYCR|nr:hypothetical protein TCDM_11240 [Trypanosoma cruzi Dm28c]